MLFYAFLGKTLLLIAFIVVISYALGLYLIKDLPAEESEVKP